jgi:cell division septum initiation protein DivIVA
MISGVVDTDSVPLLSEVTTMPSFRVAFRGYDPREVDRYAYHMEAEIEAATAIQRDLAADVRSLTDQLGRAHEELSTLRRRPAADDTVSFRHLGPRVEQILTEAHAEAEAIRQGANENAAWLREATDAYVRAVVAEHARTVADYDERERWMRAEEERLTQRLRTRQDAVARAEQYRDKVRVDAEQLLAAAQEQLERLVASTLEHAEQTMARAHAQAREIRARAEREAAALLADTERTVAERMPTTPARGSPPKRGGGKRRTAGEVEATVARR